jgi:hypothetical protein
MPQKITVLLALVAFLLFAAPWMEAATIINKSGPTIILRLSGGKTVSLKPMQSAMVPDRDLNQARIRKLLESGAISVK